MTTDEATILMYRKMPLADRRKVGEYIEKLFLQSQKEVAGLRKLTQEDVVSDVKISLAQAKAKKTKPAKTMLMEIRREYGL